MICWIGALKDITTNLSHLRKALILIVVLVNVFYFCEGHSKKKGCHFQDHVPLEFAWGGCLFVFAGGGWLVCFYLI